MGTDLYKNLAQSPWFPWARPGAPTIIGLTGVAESGKDTVGKILVEKHGYTRVSFADPLREALYRLNPTVRCGFTAQSPVQSLVDTLGWDEAKKNPEVRRLLQVLGTEVGRELLSEHVWIDLADRKINKIADQTPGIWPRIVITDVRYHNEAAFIHSWVGGLVVRVDRPGYGPVNGHDSDNTRVAVDATISNSGSLDDLHDAVQTLVVRHG